MFSCFKCGAYDLIMKVGFDHHGCSVGALEEIREAFKGGDGAPGPVGKREIAGRGDVGAAYGESVYVIRLAYDFFGILVVGYDTEANITGFSSEFSAGNPLGAIEVGHATPFAQAVEIALPI